jgi:hypothetical protein
MHLIERLCHTIKITGISYELLFLCCFDPPRGAISGKKQALESKSECDSQS